MSQTETPESNDTQELASVNYESSMDQIFSLVKAHVPIIWVTTHEEKRFILNFYKEVAQRQNKDLWTWSSYQGLVRYSTKASATRASGEQAESWNPPKALQCIDDIKIPNDRKGAIFVMKDFHTVLAQPLPRQIRDLYGTLIKQKKTLLIVAPCVAHGPSGTKGGVEPTIEKQITVVEYELPSHEAIKERIKMTVDHVRDKNKGKTIQSQLNYTDDDFSKFATALQGMTELEVDNALITCITHLKRIDERRLLLEKKQVIKRSDILEYIGVTPDFSEVGGCDDAKKYFSMYDSQFSQEAKEFGVDPLRGVLMTGVPGCVSGDTITTYNRGKRTDFRDIRVEDLYKRFNQRGDDRYKWNPEIPTYLHSFDGEGKFVKNRVLGVIDSGIKEIVEVCISIDGSNENKIVMLTPDHPICMATGLYKPAGILERGMKVLCQGSMKPQFSGGKNIKLRPKRRVVETLKYHPKASEHEVNGCTYQRSNYARLVIEAHMNSMTPEEFIDILKTNEQQSSKLKFLSRNYDVHHIDESPLNDDISNLMVMEHDGHAHLHSKVENFNVDYIQEGTVVSVEKRDEDITYDIQMEYPNNNFVADGVIVHNTGKSLLAKAVSAAWNLPLLRLDVGKVMTGLVGGSIRGSEEIIWYDEDGDSHRNTIQELVENKPDNCWVDTYTDTGLGQRGKVEAFIPHKMQPEDKLYKLMTEDGRSIITTGDHGVFSYTDNLRLKEVRVDSLNPGDFIASPGVLYVAEGTNDKGTWTEGFLAGAWLGDGDYNGKDVRYHLNIKDLPAFEAILDEGNFNYSIYDSSSSDQCKVVHVRDLQATLKADGYEGNSHTKRVPESVFGYSKEYIFGLLSGYFSTDGSFTGHILEVSSVSKLLRDDIAHLLHRVGIHAHIAEKISDSGKRTTPGTDYIVRISSETDLNKFEKKVGFIQDYKAKALADRQSFNIHGYYIPLTEKVKDEINAVRKRMWSKLHSRPYNYDHRASAIGLETVKKCIQFAPGTYYGTPITDELCTVMKAATHSEVRWVKVKSIKEVPREKGKDTVYDISVPGHGLEKFIAGSCPMLVHNSEEKMRQVIAQAEAVAPAVLWIDEIEKSLSGSKSSNFSDGGTLARVFGTLLTAMEERMEGIITIATANDIQALPPELIRRFNEVFFVDLPTSVERDEIFRIHLKKKDRNADDLKLDMEVLVAASHMYTGSEIEKAVKESVVRAFQDGKREIQTKDILGALKDTKAIAKIMKEKIDEIRSWARDRARYASSLAAAANAPGAQVVTTESGKELDLADSLDDLDEIQTEKEKEKKDYVSEEEVRTSDLLDD